MNKKHILRYPISLFLLFSLLLTACGGATETESPATQEPPTSEPALERVESAATAEPNELTILATSDPLDYPAPTAAAELPYPIPTATSIHYAYDDIASEPSRSDEGNLADANVTFVRVVHEEGDLWTFHVTVEHPDTGDDDYANGWDVITPNNEVLKAQEGDQFTRLLTHPHIDEQPFTRSQSGILIPAETAGVFVRAHDLVSGWGGEMVFVDFTQDEGANYIIER